MSTPETTIVEESEGKHVFEILTVQLKKTLANV